MVVNIYKAHPIAKEIIEDVIIKIEATFPEPEKPTKKWFRDVEQIYDKEATALEEALQKSLPQGVKDRLLIKLMGRKVSLYRGITS